MKVRKIQMKDARWVWEYRNDPKVRENMTDPTPIDWDQHLKWFEKTLGDETKLFLVAEHESTPIGIVNFSTIDTTESYWGFYVSPRFEGKGLAYEMGKLALACLFKSTSVSTVYGEVLEKNTRSQSYHEKLGFRPTGSERRVERAGTQDRLIKYRLDRLLQ